ncbi:glucooligosaccharide oxidase-like protein [Paraphoma chrysanthemicola]|uniref:Glucooligosaccharide oxidase-like protein n=1 Tax=Paraphoma chrysanthemicola TaxID=798071 RepID=A0A8K0R9P7_9PLEO|nr:glucooligosaccharide oxidase-like protein [Paraphoma chrysanthemicola]
MRSFSAFQAVSHSLLFSAVLSGAAAQDDSTRLRDCLTSANVLRTFSDAANWQTVTSPWSLRFNPEPAAVVIPRTRGDIAAALACAVDAGVKVSPLNGGHSYGAYGLGGVDGALVLNMERFTETTFDAATGLFTYGAGSRVGPAATWLWENHGRHFPHVRANWVGLAGSTIGGGFGTTSRFLGTPMDNLDSVEVMLYDGKIVKASRTVNPDLFFVVQGAGSSYGILLSLTTRTWKPQFDTVTNFTISLGNVDLDTGAQALIDIQDWAMTEAPDTFALRWQLAGEWNGSGYFYGNPAEFDAIFASLVERLPNTTTTRKTTTDFWSMENFAVPLLNGTTDAFPARSMYLQALVLRSDKPFTFASAKALYQHTTLAFNRTDLTEFGFLDLWGGVSRNVKDNAQAMAYANNQWLIRWEGRLANGLTQWPADATEYMQAGFRPFQEQLKKEGIPLRGFVNYRDTELTKEQWSVRLYGNNFEKMKRIKTKYDPRGVFTTHPQSIPSS